MNQNNEINLLQILSDTVEDYFNIPRGQLKLNKTRKKEIKEPRQIAFFFAMEFLYPKNGKLYSETNIGKFFDKDHATVIHANKTIRNLYDTEKKIKDDIDEIRKILTANFSFIISKDEIKQTIYDAIIQRFKILLAEKNKYNMKMSMFFDMNKIINDLKHLDA